MSRPAPLPINWVDALFKKFLIRYGRMWIDRYAGLGLSADEVAEEWAKELAGFTGEEIARGLEGSQTSRFPPTLPEFIGLCRPAALDRCHRPGSDEAWAIALKAHDESETVVWTEEMAQAWGVCRPVMAMGDEVGARMAFKATYDRLVTEAKLHHRQAVWVVSEGFDKDLRLAALKRAESAGLLSWDGAKESMLMLESPTFEVSPMPAHIREQIAELRKKMAGTSDHPSRASLDRQRTTEMKQEAAHKAAAYEAARQQVNA